MPVKQTVSGVSVIVPHYDDLPNLVRCVAALRAQTITPHEVLIVDNGSPCGPDAIRSALGGDDDGRIRLIFEAERGAGPARNAGVAASSGEILAFADGDVEVAEDWLERGRLAMALAPIVGGRVDVEPSGTAPPTPIELWDMMFGFDAEKFLKHGGHLLTGNLFVRRAAFEEVGPFRNGIPEDTEWCQRARRAGYTLTYDPTIVVTHPTLTRWDKMAARWRRMAREQYLWNSERRFGVLAYWIRSFAVLVSIVPHGLRVLTNPRIKADAKFPVIAILARVRFLRFASANQLVFFGPNGLSR